MKTLGIQVNGELLNLPGDQRPCNTELEKAGQGCYALRTSDTLNQEGRQIGDSLRCLLLP